MGLWTPQERLIRPEDKSRAALVEDNARLEAQLKQVFTMLAAIVTNPGALEVLGTGQVAVDGPTIEGIPSGTTIQFNPAIDRSRMVVTAKLPAAGLGSGKVGLVGAPMQMIHKKKDGSIEVH